MLPDGILAGGYPSNEKAISLLARLSADPSNTPHARYPIPIVPWRPQAIQLDVVLSDGCVLSLPRLGTLVKQETDLLEVIG